MGDLTAHFSRREFRCGCGKIHGDPAPQLLAALERLRALVGMPLPIVSGVRCATFNRRIGGIRASQHLTGRAADIPGYYATVGQCHDSGFIGVGTREGRVIHVDVTPGRRPFTFLD
jgi:uncharacterized protein YcbK (DUF882 family)